MPKLTECPDFIRAYMSTLSEIEAVSLKLKQLKESEKKQSSTVVTWLKTSPSHKLQILDDEKDEMFLCVKPFRKTKSISKKHIQTSLGNVVSEFTLPDEEKSLLVERATHEIWVNRESTMDDVLSLNKRVNKKRPRASEPDSDQTMRDAIEAHFQTPSTTSTE